MATDKIKQQTVVSQVMDKIRTLIASGEYGPGDKIPTEKELAERFGIGRSSIREAIKIFNYLGILESRAALGTFVQQRSTISSEAITWSLLLGSDELEEIIDLRGSIELWCLLRLVRDFSNGAGKAVEVVDSLQKIVDSMKRFTVEGLSESLIEEDFRFHLTIINSASIPLFSSIYDTLRSFLYAEIQRSQADYQDPALIAAEHGQLLAVIRGGSTEAAVEAYIAHIGNIKLRLKAPRG